MASSKELRSQMRGCAVSKASLFGTAGRGAAVEAAAAGRQLVGGAQSRPVWPAGHATTRLWRYELSFQRHERGLPLPQRVDTGYLGPGSPASAGLFLRRWICGWRWLGATL